MPIQTTCPECGTTFRVADTSRGKKLRCSRCKTVFMADAAADGGNGSSAIAPTPSRAKLSSPSLPRRAAPREAIDDEDDADRFVKKPNKSILPYLLIGLGVFVFLCGGGSVGGLIAWNWYDASKKQAAERERAEQQQQLAEEAHRRFQVDLERAQAEHERHRGEMQKRIGENLQEEARLEQERQKRIAAEMEEQRKMIQQVFDNMKDIAPNILPPDMNLPPNAGNPVEPERKGEVVQAVSLSIPLDAPPHAVFGVLWTGASSKQTLVVRIANGQMGIARYDWTNGRKLGSVETPMQSLITSIRDVSPDGNYYLCNYASRFLSLRNLRDGKQIMEKWQPPPIKREAGGLTRNNLVAAYLLNDGQRLLTVNGSGQVAAWSVPKSTSDKPVLQESYVPAETARYASNLADKVVALSPDRTRLALFNGRDGFVLLDTATLKLQGVLTSPEDALPTGPSVGGLYGVAFSPDGNHLAAVIHAQPFRPGAMDNHPQLIRWDVKTQKRTARFDAPAQGPADPGARLGWWGNDYVWLAATLQPAVLVSWAKQRVVLRTALRIDEKICLGNSDGKCWFVVAGPDSNAVLKSIDLPAAALVQADQPLELTKEGIVRK
jgi:predicted Zn finger-like uncharacterized protein